MCSMGQWRKQGVNDALTVLSPGSCGTVRRGWCRPLFSYTCTSCTCQPGFLSEYLPQMSSTCFLVRYSSTSKAMCPNNPFLFIKCLSQKTDSRHTAKTRCMGAPPHPSHPPHASQRHSPTCICGAWLLSSRTTRKRSLWRMNMAVWESRKAMKFFWAEDTERKIPWAWFLSKEIKCKWRRCDEEGLKIQQQWKMHVGLTTKISFIPLMSWRYQISEFISPVGSMKVFVPTDLQGRQEHWACRIVFAMKRT